MSARLRFDHFFMALVAMTLASCGGRSVGHFDDPPGVPPPPKVDGGPLPPVLDGGPLPPPFDGGPQPPPPIAEEKVTCEFHGSTSMQGCRSSLGQGCSGVSSCSVIVTATAGTRAAWSSSCAGSASTIVDGADETVHFKCGAGPVDGGPVPPPPIAYEAVTCRFYGSNAMQECYSSLGVGCKGVTSCVVKLSGPPSIVVDWKSTCGGYASTVLDGIDEDAAFQCPANPPPPPPPVTEVVTCLFEGSPGTQECFSSLGPSCKGVGSCSVQVSGTSGMIVDWKSTCGGYASTVLDGFSEDAWFYCDEPPPPPPPPPLKNEIVTCLFLNSTTLQECYSSIGLGCQGVSSCTVPVKGIDGDQVMWKSTCGNYAHTVTDGFDEYATFQCAASPTPY